MLKKIDSFGIRTHASKEIGASKQRLRPLGHATRWQNAQKTNLISSTFKKSKVELSFVVNETYPP